MLVKLSRIMVLPEGWFNVYKSAVNFYRAVQRSFPFQGVFNAAKDDTPKKHLPPNMKRKRFLTGIVFASGLNLVA